MDKPMERRGLGGLSKLGGMAGKPDPMKQDAGKTDGESGDGETSSITSHGDGTHTSTMGGKTTEHPDHLHLMAHIGHHVTGGDKHHVTHHDGMSMHSHGVHESGEHTPTEEHSTPEEAGQATASMMGDGEDGGQDQPMDAQSDSEPAYGGMRG